MKFNIQNKFKLRTPWIFLIVLGTGCDSLITEVEAPTTNVKPVMHLAISNLNDVYKARVTLSQPVYGTHDNERFTSIQDGILFVSLNGETDSIEYRELNDFYEGRRTIDLEPGATYNLQFHSPDYNFSAVETCPYPVTGVGIDYDTMVHNGTKRYRLRYSWDDNPSATDHYVMEYYQVREESGFTDTLYIGFNSPTNITRSNGKVKCSDEVWIWYDDFPTSKDKLMVIVNRVSPTFYKHQNALKTFNPDFPFSEPSPLPGNVIGGIGYFGISQGEVLLLE